MAIVNARPAGENDSEYQEALAKATSTAEMFEIERNYYLAHGATMPDRSGKLDLSNFQDPSAAASGTISRTIKIAGVDVTFSDSNLPALEAQISAALQTAAANGGGTQPRGADGKFTSRREMSLAEKTELDLKFRRGEISTPDFLKQSGALDEAFATMAKAKLGVDVEELEKNRQTQNVWAEATQKWLNSPEGEKWDGGDGDENLRRVREIIIANGLENSPSVQTLSQVVKFARENHLLVPPAGTTEKAITDARSPEEISSAARASLGLPPRNSNLWGR
jgi:hypothetical protein